MAMSAAGFFFFIAVAALLPSSHHLRRLTAIASSPSFRRRRLAAIAAVNVASHNLSPWRQSTPSGTPLAHCPHLQVRWANAGSLH